MTSSNPWFELTMRTRTPFSTMGVNQHLTLIDSRTRLVAPYSYQATSGAGFESGASAGSGGGVTRSFKG
jgi:hypothetical protein